MGREPAGREITPESVYFNRRTFLKAGAVATAGVGTAAVYRYINRQPPPTPEPPALAGLISAGTPEPATASAPVDADAAGSSTQTAAAASDGGEVSASMRKAFTTDEPKTPFQNVTHHNNFYEFSTGKEEVATMVGGFTTAGWKVVVDGLVSKPLTLDLDMLRKAAPLEERVYRMRCVEAWSMVIPWAGYSLSKLLAKAMPKSDAKFVAFTSLYDPKRFPGQETKVLAWPYVEGLRLDEAMNPLTLVTLGLYGKELPAQDGAPVRMVMPWKYGFKGIKSIVKISLVSEMPPTSWNRYSSEEYGFYANVNPNHPHPRWSQAMETRLTDEQMQIPTQMFNGYGEQVAGMYAGMDLDENF